MVDARQKRYEELLKNLIDDEAVRRNIDGICKVLFPQLESRSTRSDDEWEHELRICSPERFNFYFQLGIPSGEISESEIDGVVESMTNQSAFKALIVQFKEEKRLRKVLRKLVRHGKTLGEEKLQNALAVLWEMEKQIDDEPEVGFDIDTSTEICQLGYNALKELPGSNRKHLLAALIRGCPNIFYPAHFLVELRRDLGKQGAENAILNDNDLKELEEILLGKIKNAAENGSLKDEKRLVGLLYRWRTWESAEAVSEYIRALISSRAGLLTFLKAFVSKMISSAGNYNYLNRNSINELYPIGEIESLVNE